MNDLHPPGGAASASARAHRDNVRFEIAATIVLALAALATAWSGYQASLWDGVQSSNYTQASAARTSAAQLQTYSNQLRIADLSLFESYLDADAQGLEDLAQFYRQRFRDEFSPAFDAWEATDPFSNPNAPKSPFVMPEYQLASEKSAEALLADAEASFNKGEDANNFSDAYTLATLLLAAVLFFAAISERFDHRPSRMVLLGFAAVGLVGGIAVAASQPITFG